MKLKSILTILVLLTFIVTTHVHTYWASSNCWRNSHTYTSAAISSSGLSNGSYRVYAKVTHSSTRSSSFVNNVISASVSDIGSSSSSGSASAFVSGYTSGGSHQTETSSCSI